MEIRCQLLWPVSLEQKQIGIEFHPPDLTFFDLKIPDLKIFDPLLFTVIEIALRGFGSLRSVAGPPIYKRGAHRVWKEVMNVFKLLISSEVNLFRFFFFTIFFPVMNLVFSLKCHIFKFFVFSNKFKLRYSVSSIRSLIFALVILLLLSTSTFGQETPGVQKIFRVDSSVKMTENDIVTEIKTSTVFGEDAVFDFIGDNGEIIVYQWKDRKFTLIDPIHRVQTDLSLDDVDTFLERIRSMLLEKKDKFTHFMLDPQFEITVNEQRSSLIFQSKYIDYIIRTRPFDDPALLDDYYHFSQAYSKLNIYLNPGTTTPFARIVINEDLFKRGFFPERFDISVYPKGKWLFGKVVKIESEHKMVRRLSEKDKGRIVRTIHFTEQFPKIPFGKYQKALQDKN